MREFKERSFGGRSRTRSDNNRSRGSFDRESSGFGERRLEMHNAICDKCKKECQIPFRPTQGKPVYCSDCFRNKDSYESRGEGPRSSEASPDLLTEINAKLDKIMRALKLN